MPRIYKGGAAQVAVMYYPCAIDPSKVEDLKITLYSEGNNIGITYTLNEIAIDDNNIAVVSVSKTQLDSLSDGVIKYISEGVVDGKPFVIDRYSNYFVHTPSEYDPSTDATGYVTFDDLSETLNGYITEDELQEQLNNIDSVPYLVVDGFSYTGFKIKNGDFDAVAKAYDENRPYLIYVRATDTGRNYSLAEDVQSYNGEISCTSTFIVIGGNITLRIWKIYKDNVELYSEEKYKLSDFVDKFNYILDLEGLQRYFDEELNKTSNVIANAIDKKQNILLSGENIKTINGNSILGEGDITIEGGGADVDLSDYVTKDELNKKGYITGIPSEYVTETELNAKGYATTASVNNKQDKLTSGSNIKTINGNSLLGSGNITIKTDVDLSGYVTTDALNSKGYLTSVPSEYITETELSGMGYATQSYVDAQVGDIETILDNIIGNK